MSVTRKDIVDVVKSWSELKESDGSYKSVIDIYNTISPLPRGYVLKYTDDWGAGAVSAAYKQAGAANIFPTECGCAPMIQKAQLMEIWIESDSYIPKIADVCMFDSYDDGEGDNTGTPDRVGIVIAVSKSSRTFVVVEGNKDRAVGSRTLPFNGKYIRGYISPIFEEDSVKPPPKSEYVITTETTPTVSSKPTQVGTGTLSKVAAGSPMKLLNTPMYASPATQSVSAYKTGTYYIWGVDTVNNRVRITNAKSNVGVKGQVTGWIDAAVAIALALDSAPSAVSAATPLYQPNAVYVVQVDDLAVKQGPGTSYDKVGYSGLTANAKKYDKNKTGCLNRGAKVTCLDVQVKGANVWIQIPSGWIPAYYNKQFYVK